MTIIVALLAVAAAYSGGMWLFTAVQSFRAREAYETRPDLADRIELYTFHLGLCFILALGFIGLIVGEG